VLLLAFCFPFLAIKAFNSFESSLDHAQKEVEALQREEIHLEKVAYLEVQHLKVDNQEKEESQEAV